MPPKTEKYALLSIKPEFADKIFDGTKKYEFRRLLFKQNVSKVVVYASTPVQRIIGEFSIEDILFLEVNKLWRLTSQYSGITKDYFYRYFHDKESGYAIKIGKSKKYRKSLCIKKDFGLLPPQSFIYVKH